MSGQSSSNESRPRKILIVDDHSIVREGLRGMLQQQLDLAVGGEAGSIAEAFTQMAEVPCDGAIVDVSLGRENGLELVAKLRERFPSMAILVLSMHDEMVFAERALRAGANGYIMKHEAVALLLTALRQILRGRVFVGPAVSDRLLSSMSASPKGDNRYGIDRLSNREIEIFQLIGTGLVTSEIAAQLKISPKTVETHRARIKEKLGIETAAELIIQAAHWMKDGTGG